MTISVKLERQAEVRPVRGATTNRKPLLKAAAPRPEFSTSKPAFPVFAALRAHPHISSVLTHISRANSGNVERSLNSILDPATTSDSLSPA